MAKSGTGRKRQFSNSDYEIRWPKGFNFPIHFRAFEAFSPRRGCHSQREQRHRLPISVLLIRGSTRCITSRRGPGRVLSLSLHDFLVSRPPTDSLIRRLTLRSTDIAFVKELIANGGYFLWMKKKNLRLCPCWLISFIWRKLPCYRAIVKNKHISNGIFK